MAGLNKLPKGSKCAERYRSGPKKGRCKRFRVAGGRKRGSSRRRRKSSSRRKSSRRSRCKVVNTAIGRRRLCWGKNGKITSNTRPRKRSR